jgi:hypothetical protein
MRSVFIDESKARDFILCAVTIEAQMIPFARSITRQQVMPGQRHIHFVSEGRRRKLAILRAYSRISCRADFIIVKTGKPAARRERAIRHLTSILPTGSNTNLVFDNDENYNLMDRNILRQELNRQLLSAQVSYAHLPSRSESLLWIPDALAWSKARGKEWGRALEKFDTVTHRLD